MSKNAYDHFDFINLGGMSPNLPHATFFVGIHGRTDWTPEYSGKFVEVSQGAVDPEHRWAVRICAQSNFLCAFFLYSATILLKEDVNNIEFNHKIHKLYGNYT